MMAQTKIQKNNLIRTFTIGFIPLLIFIVADELFGTEIGLITAIAVGAAEFLYYYLRFRLVEKFVLLDTALIIALGGVSLAMHDDLLFKLKPALIQGILVVLLGIHAFSDSPVILRMSKRFLGDMKFSPEQEQMLRKMTRLLFFVVVAHTALIVYSAYYMSKEAWAFISGGLFYIIFGVILAGQFITAKLKQRKAVSIPVPDDGEEWFDLVNAEGKIVGRAPRSRVHGDPSLLHPVVHVHVFNKKGQLFLQKRSLSKDVQPGKWDTAVGGHIHSGETVEAALKRESEEELGIRSAAFIPLYRYVMRNDYESELVHTFRLDYNGPFLLNKEELAGGRFWNLKDIERKLGQGVFTPNFEQEFQMLAKYYASQAKNR